MWDGETKPYFLGDCEGYVVKAPSQGLIDEIL